MAKAIEVVLWQETFEKSDLKKTERWSWIAMPIRFDGRGYRRVAARKDGDLLFCRFTLIVEVAGNMPRKGLLVDAGGLAVDAEELAVKTGFSAAGFDHAFDVLSNPEAKIGWLRWVDIPDIRIDPDASGSIGPTLQTGPNKTEHDQECSEAGKPPTEPDVTLLAFSTVGPVKSWNLTEGFLAELSSAYPNVDVLAESRKALAWCKADPGRRKTAKGMRRFLTGWMGRAVDRGRSHHPFRAAGAPRADELDPDDAEMIREMESRGEP